MLELRPNCEACDKDLAPNADDAFICSYECTFCHDCVEKLANVCPNCGGGFCRRPVRPKIGLRKFPASTERVVKPVDEKSHNKLKERYAEVPPHER